MIQQYTCIICPNGCEIDVHIDDSSKKIVKTEGNLCPKGEAYVRQEIQDPRRTIATSVLVTGGVMPLASVRLTKAIPKDKIFSVMEEIKKVMLTAPVLAGSVVIGDVLGLGSDVIVTRSVDAV
jgi:CxxC motif-containing protein